MAFPGDYTNYHEITIDSGEVSADLTDFPVFVDLSDLSLGGADIFDTCRSDGGDIRVTKTDGTTQLPVDLVVIDTTAKTGELHFKFTGTLSSSSDTVVRIWYNGTDTAPASDSTYGSEAVWSNYMAVSHFQEASGTISDSTGNGNTGAVAGSTTYGAAGQLSGSGLSLDGTGDYISYTGLSNNDLQSGDFTIQIWANKDNTDDQQRIVDYSNTVVEIAYKERGTTGYEGTIYDGAYNTVASDQTTGVWRKFTLSYDDSATTMNFLIDGTSVGTDTSTNNPAQTGNLRIGSNAESSAEQLAGDVDEFRFIKGVITADWDATEFSNQSAPSSFYSVSAEQGGGLSPIAANTLTATFSLPARTVVSEITLIETPATLSATFSIPAYSLTLENAFAQSTLSATFSIPSYTLDLGGNLTLSPTTLSATFSIPSYILVLESIVGTNDLSATFSLPSYVVTGHSIQSPSTLAATFSLPSYTLDSDFNVVGQKIVPNLSLKRERVIINKK